jgi:hypothetical protein
MARKISKWTYAIVLIVLLAIVYTLMGGSAAIPVCPGSLVYCPGVGCLSGQDKCFAGARGGPSKVFSKETFAQRVAESAIIKKCPDGTRSDGQCLMEFS